MALPPCELSKIIITSIISEEWKSVPVTSSNINRLAFSDSVTKLVTSTVVNEEVALYTAYEEMEGPQQWYSDVLSLTFIAIIVATILNVLALIVFIRNKTARKPVNETVVSMTVGGILYGVNIPLHFIDIYFPTISITNRTVCLLIYVMDYTVMVLSNLNVVLMTIDRYVAIVHPFVYSKYDNALPGVRWLIGTIWLYSLIAGIPHFFYSKWTPTSYCIPERTIETVLVIVLVFPVITLGGIAIIIIYIRIYFEVAGVHRRVHFVHSQVDANMTANKKKQEFKFTFIILLIVVIYLICWYPAMIMMNLIPFTFYTSAISQLLIVFNALFDPIVYIWIIGEFRENFRKIFNCFIPADSNTVTVRSPTTRIIHVTSVQR